MNNEKEYKSLVVRVKKAYLFAQTDSTKKVLEDILPTLRESEDERIRKEIISAFKFWFKEGVTIIPEEKGGRITVEQAIAYLEKQKEHVPKNEESGTRKEQKLPEREGVYYYDGDGFYWIGAPTTEEIAMSQQEKQKEQKPAEKQDYSGLNDLERAILRGFLSAGVENVSITIIKETALECLAQMNPAEWNDTDMKEARDSLISVCRDWERGQKTTLLPIAAVRARYFLEHLTEPKPAEWSEEDEKKIGRLRSVVNQLASYTDSLDVNGDYCEGDYAELDTWLKSLHPQLQGTYKLIVHNIYEMLKDKDFFDIPPSHRVSLLNDIRVRCKNADEQAEILDVPSWKPSEWQMSMLLAVINDPSNAGSESCHLALTSLYNYLKKLM